MQTGVIRTMVCFHRFGSLINPIHGQGRDHELARPTALGTFRGPTLGLLATVVLHGGCSSRAPQRLKMMIRITSMIMIIMHCAVLLLHENNDALPGAFARGYDNDGALLCAVAQCAHDDALPCSVGHVHVDNLIQLLLMMISYSCCCSCPGASHAVMFSRA